MPNALPRLLVAGVGPLPPEAPERLFAPGLRVWGMARELARAGHAVRLVCGRFGEQGDRAGGDEAAIFDLQSKDLKSEDLKSEDHKSEDLKSEILRSPIPLPAPRRERLSAGGWAALLAREVLDFRAAAAVATTDVMNHALACASLEIPIWMDYFGDPMAERQMLALAQGSDEGLAAQWALLAPALARADRLSGCGGEQCAALRGQLGAVGRLGRLTAREELVHEIAPWIEPIEPDEPIEPGASPAPGKNPLVRGALAPPEAFLVVQTGGFNTWLDVQTLFAALEQAIAIDSRIHFAASGGAIPGHHAEGFAWFERAAAASRCAGHFHLLGWRPLREVPALLAEADLGLNLDLACVEGRHGTRNRLMDWLLAGLPVVSTPGCELARELGGAGYLKLVAHGDAAATARAITAVAAAPGDFRKAAGAGADYLRRTHSAAGCLAPLLEWAARPKPASDLQAWRKGEASPPVLWTLATASSASLRGAQYEAQRRAWLERRLDRLEGSRLVHWALRLRGRDDLEVDPPPREP